MRSDLCRGQDLRGLFEMSAFIYSVVALLVFFSAGAFLLWMSPDDWERADATGNRISIDDEFDEF